MRDVAEQLLPPLKDVINLHELNAKKALGQNFLLDMNLTWRIVRETLRYLNQDSFNGAHVFEIGSGPGGLSRAILAGEPSKYTIIELDKRCIKIAEEIKSAYQEYPTEIEIIEGNALKVDLISISKSPRHIIANLPYNVSTALLTNWLENYSDFASMTLMFQKEVAQRLIAAPASDSYGRLSVLTQWLCDVRVLFDVPPQAFTPPPKVTSSVVMITPKKEIKLKPSIESLSTVTAAAFGQRRKMLRSSLKSLGDVEELCAKANIDPSLRAERLSVDDFCRLALVFEQK